MLGYAAALCCGVLLGVGGCALVIGLCVAAGRDAWQP